MGISRIFIVVLVALSCVAVTPPAPDQAFLKRFTPINAGRSAEDYTAVGQKGMVASAHPLASEAGKKMLELGGNAIDAAVAASFVIGVVRPQSTGLGGGGFMVYHNAKTNHNQAFDFRERAPHRATATMYVDQKNKYIEPIYQGHKISEPSVVGHLAVAVPGLVKGLVEIEAADGKLGLETVMQPAIELARHGFEVYPALAKEIDSTQEWLGLYSASKSIFFKGDRPLKAGDRLVQSDLANTLTIISKTGSKEFYEGNIAKKILAEMVRGHGLVDQQDLRAYRAIERAVVTGHYRGHRIVTMPPPSSGGVHLIEMLNMLETKDVAQMQPRGPTYLHLLAEVMRRAFADRAKEMGDPDFVTLPISRLTSKTYAKTLIQSFNPNHATASSTMGIPLPRPESPSTSHISVVDQEGNAVSTTQTVNYSFGSCVVAAGTGIVLNDEMDDFTTKNGGQNVFGLVQGPNNNIAPGKTPLSSMTPTIMVDAKGAVELVVGAPGGPRIINAVLQTIVNTIDFKMSLLDAVHATRIHHQWMPDQLSVEKESLDPDTKQQLTARGHHLNDIKSIGDIQAIAKQADGGWLGVSDSRSDGRPAGF